MTEPEYDGIGQSAVYVDSSEECCMTELDEAFQAAFHDFNFEL